LPNEWQFLHRVIPDIGDLFAPIEEALKKHLIAILNPITSEETNYKDSTLVCSHLIRALRGQEAFSPSKSM
jgi:hypothetical protein